MDPMYSWPESDILEHLYNKVPIRMRPNKLPTAIIARNFLSKTECEAITESLMGEPMYQVPGCNAHTIQAPFPAPLQLSPIQNLAEVLNEGIWKYDMDEDPISWLQTYKTGDDYHLHSDAYPATMRKLTAVAFLTPPAFYEGGDLVLHYFPDKHVVPNYQGTVVVFEPHTWHEVTPIVKGLRQTINMGFYGPNFR